DWIALAAHLPLTLVSTIADALVGSPRVIANPPLSRVSTFHWASADTPRNAPSPPAEPIAVLSAALPVALPSTDTVAGKSATNALTSPLSTAASSLPISFCAGGGGLGAWAWATAVVAQRTRAASKARMALVCHHDLVRVGALGAIHAVVLPVA